MADASSKRMIRCRFVAVLLLICLRVLPASPDDKIPGLRLDGEKFTCEEAGKPTFRGFVVKPEGRGPFPAVLISHGLGGNAEGYARPKAREFVKLGYVCIAPDYAHSDPKGERKNFGASAENLRRAGKCLDLLASMPEVDPRRICALGNSMGAYLTIGLAAEQPNRLAAAAITAGGISPVAGFAAPSAAQAAKIRAPICILHGTADTTVPPERSRMLEEVLTGNKIVCERHLYEGVGHDLHAARAADVTGKIEAWFRKHAGPR